MPSGNGVNCGDCGELKQERCKGGDLTCLCYRCPRKLAECMCVRYCRETESVLYFDDENNYN